MKENKVEDLKNIGKVYQILLKLTSELQSDASKLTNEEKDLFVQYCGRIKVLYMIQNLAQIYEAGTYELIRTKLGWVDEFDDEFVENFDYSKYQDFIRKLRNSSCHGRTSGDEKVSFINENVFEVDYNEFQNFVDFIGVKTSFSDEIYDENISVSSDELQSKKYENMEELLNSYDNVTVAIKRDNLTNQVFNEVVEFNNTINKNNISVEECKKLFEQKFDKEISENIIVNGNSQIRNALENYMGLFVPDFFELDLKEQQIAKDLFLKKQTNDIGGMISSYIDIIESQILNKECTAKSQKEKFEQNFLSSNTKSINNFINLEFANNYMFYVYNYLRENSSKDNISIHYAFVPLEDIEVSHKSSEKDSNTYDKDLVTGTIKSIKKFNSGLAGITSFKRNIKAKEDSKDEKAQKMKEALNKKITDLKDDHDQIINNCVNISKNYLLNEYINNNEIMPENQASRNIKSNMLVRKLRNSITHNRMNWYLDKNENQIRISFWDKDEDSEFYANASLAKLLEITQKCESEIERQIMGEVDKDEIEVANSQLIEESGDSNNKKIVKYTVTQENVELNEIKETEISDNKESNITLNNIKNIIEQRKRENIKFN